MKTDDRKQFKNMVVAYVVDQENLDDVMIDQTVDSVRLLPMFANLTDEDVNIVRNEIKSELAISLDKGTLIKEKGHQKWFLDKKRNLEMRYWERYKQYLRLDKKFPTKVINTMDDILDTLTDLLGDPERDIIYSRKGLIIGDVQSGKTANYIGLMCKAADAGYKVIVLLTGTIEKLRKQTQQRVDEGFVGMDSDAMMKGNEDAIVVGVGRYDTSVIKPMVLTSTTDDFKQKNATNLNFDLRNINGPVVFVVKKNVSVLKRLNKWLKTYNQNGEDKINHSLLMIDDESDNASVNTKNADSPTAINGQLRTMLNAFKKSSYVGFTATPFANIFIDPDTADAMEAEDLFPKDYIYSLNAPSNYIGARNIFSEDGEHKNMLVAMDTDCANAGSISSILPLKHKSSAWMHKLPDDLREAIRAFIIANTIRDLKGHENTHRSMLVNISRFRGVQGQATDLVNEYLKEIQNSCRLYSKRSIEEAVKDDNIKDLKETYEKIYPDEKYDWRIIQNELYSSSASIMVQKFNLDSGQNFDFDSFPNGARVIAVGGMSLSRGLTLEGLMISYFYRNSKMYDALMQMGRWFGYRGDYASLCRIWMSEESIEWYRYISMATDELRDEVKSYEDSGLTPLDFGLRVRSDMAALVVTAANKMRSADKMECLVSISGETLETAEIYTDIEKNKINKDAVIDFNKTLVTEGYKKKNFARAKHKETWGYENVDKAIVKELLENIEVSPKNVKFNVSSIRSFLDQYKGNDLNLWNIVFATGEAEAEYDIGNGISGKCRRLKYSIENEGKIIKLSGSKRRLGNTNDGTFGLEQEDIEKVKQEVNRSGRKNPAQKDYFRYIMRRNPLLIVYHIKLGDLTGSITEETLKMDEELKENVVIGFGIGIPELANAETKYVKYALNKIAMQNLLDGEGEDFDEGDDD